MKIGGIVAFAAGLVLFAIGTGQGGLDAAVFFSLCTMAFALGGLLFVLAAKKKAAAQSRGNLQFCRNCGTRVEGQFCSKCGTPAAAAPATQEAPGSLQGEFKRCPKCAETIRLEAMVCRFCNHSFSEDEVRASQAQAREAQEQARVHLAAMQAEALRVRKPEYAGFWLRLAALLIDSVIVGVLWLLACTLFTLVFFTTKHAHPPGSTTGPVFFTLLAVLLLLYPALLESSNKQATWGKMALGVVVTDLNRKRISRARALARALTKILSGLPFYAGYIFAAFTKKKQALHDIIASTLVVPKERT
jgi:uncharacterized RDD family membrane protein YckC